MSDLKREDVEALLATLEQIHKPNNGTLAELCRIGLAWLDAIEHDGDYLYNEYAYEECRDKRVRIVVCGDSEFYTLTQAGREHLDGKAGGE